MSTLSKITLQTRAQQFSNLVAMTSCTNHLAQPVDLEDGIEQFLSLLVQARKNKHHLFIIGNGGSAAVASHIENDLCNVGKLCVSTLHEPAILTCFSNDYGYDQAFAKRLELAVRADDILIAISSSGGSKNILNAVDKAHELGAQVITLSGWGKENSLRQLGELNFWLESQEYGQVEIGHLFILHHLCDLLGQVET